MKREEIETQYLWDLSSIYANNDDFYQDVEHAKTLLQQLAQYKDQLTNSYDNFSNFLFTQTKLERVLSKLYCFAHLHCDVTPNDQTYQTMLSTILALFQQTSIDLAFVDLEICQNEDNVNSYLKHDELASYRYGISNVLAYKPHMLDKAQEELLSKVDSISNVSSNVFDSLRLEFEDVIVDGEKKTLNNATLTEFLKNKDENVRKMAYHNFFKEYKRYENTYANTLSGVMKKDAFYANVRKFDSSLVASVFHDDVPTDLFFKVLDMANRKYRPLFHKYNELKKKILNKDVLYNYDLNIPLVNDQSGKYTIEECFSIIKECLKPFGDDYLSIIEKAKEERWIDYYPTPGKRIGAYSSGCYDTNPFILMNFIGDYNSLSTMIHELGHSVHTYLSCKYQDAQNSDYRIFVAEVASTVNETLLINYMMDHAKTKEEKAYFIYEQLENCVGLLFRQPMFADFEYKLHTMAERNEPMSSKIITDLYAKLNQEYFGDAVTMDEYVGWSCYYVPHFYYNYYVYKYTLGMTVALAIVKRILAGDRAQVDRYLKFLQSGGSKSPVDLLIDAGVNPLEDALYDDAFCYFESLLETFVSLYES